MEAETCSFGGHAGYHRVRQMTWTANEGFGGDLNLLCNALCTSCHLNHFVMLGSGNTPWQTTFPESRRGRPEVREWTPEPCLLVLPKPATAPTVQGGEWSCRHRAVFTVRIRASQTLAQPTFCLWATMNVWASWELGWGREIRMCSELRVSILKRNSPDGFPYPSFPHFFSLGELDMGHASLRWQICYVYPKFCDNSPAPSPQHHALALMLKSLGICESCLSLCP